MPTRILLLVVSLLVLAGCGGPKQVTYVDPNGASPRGNVGEQVPVEQYGAAAMERAKAIVRVRGALAAARPLAATDADAAAGLIEDTISRDLPFVEGRTARTDPQLALRLRGDLESLRDAAPPPGPAYARAVRRIIDGSLTAAERVAVPAPAREDPGFRAVVLYETLLNAAEAYEAALDGGTNLVSIDEYRTAYGLLTVVTTQQLEAVPQAQRARIRSALTNLTRRAVPGPTPPASPRDAEAVGNELSAVADDVITLAGVDPTYPSPAAAAPDDLRSLKRAVAALLGSSAREGAASADAVRAADAWLVKAADSVAAVAPELLAQLEHGLLRSLADAAESGADVAVAAADLDASIDEAIMLVEEELELLRESE